MAHGIDAHRVRFDSDSTQVRCVYWPVYWPGRNFVSHRSIRADSMLPSCWASRRGQEQNDHFFFHRCSSTAVNKECLNLQKCYHTHWHTRPPGTSRDKGGQRSRMLHKIVEYPLNGDPMGHPGLEVNLATVAKANVRGKLQFVTNSAASARACSRVS